MSSTAGSWRVQVVRNGRFQFSWHATEAEARKAARDQRERGLWQSVRVSFDEIGPVKAVQS